VRFSEPGAFCWIVYITCVNLLSNISRIEWRAVNPSRVTSHPRQPPTSYSTNGHRKLVHPISAIISVPPRSHRLLPLWRSAGRTVMAGQAMSATRLGDSFGRHSMTPRGRPSAHGRLPRAASAITTIQLPREGRTTQSWPKTTADRVKTRLLDPNLLSVWRLKCPLSGSFPPRVLLARLPFGK
jgi:hypothetical protein